MIVRIASDGQYEFPDAQSDQLNDLDNQVVAAVEAGDEARFNDLWGKMVELVRSSGTPVPDDELVGSDVILPPPDISLAEAAAEFTGEGLIPD
jgi:PspA-Associated protein